MSPVLLFLLFPCEEVVLPAAPRDPEPTLLLLRGHRLGPNLTIWSLTLILDQINEPRLSPHFHPLNTLDEI